MKKSKCKNKTIGLWNFSTTCTLETSLLVSFHRLSQELLFGHHPGSRKECTFLFSGEPPEQVWDRPMSSQHLRVPSFQIGLSLLIYRRETRKDRVHTLPPGPYCSLSFSPLGHSHLTSPAHLCLQSLPSVL